MISEQGIELIKDHEGLALKAYPDPGSKDGKPWTIGYGHTLSVKEGDTCTPEQAEDWLWLDCENIWVPILNLVKVPLNQNQFDAIISFVFNIGLNAFEHSTMLRVLNNGDYVGAANEMLRWNINDGKIMKGLAIRREDERALFLKD